MTRRPSPWIRTARRAAWFLVFILLCLGTAWAAFALCIDLRPPSLGWPAAVVYVTAVILVVLFLRFSAVSVMICFVSFVGVVLWWCSIEPSSDTAWQPDFARTAWAETDGDQVTIHNFRNFDYEVGLPAQARWETKTVDLSQLRAVDLYINFWGSTLICHPIVSFQFGPTDHVAVSVETRMAQGQTYSLMRGFFKQFQLIYIVADERDVIRVRTNYRHEQLYLYRTSINRKGLGNCS